MEQQLDNIEKKVDKLISTLFAIEKVIETNEGVLSEKQYSLSNAIEKTDVIHIEELSIQKTAKYYKYTIAYGDKSRAGYISGNVLVKLILQHLSGIIENNGNRITDIS